MLSEIVMLAILRFCVGDKNNELGKNQDGENLISKCRRVCRGPHLLTPPPWVSLPITLEPELSYYARRAEDQRL